MNRAVVFWSIVASLAPGLACLRAPPTPAVVEPPPTVRHEAHVPEFSGQLEVGQTYSAVLVRRFSTDVWVPALPGTATPAQGVKVVWLNPEVLAGIDNRDPMDRRVVFEVVNRDMDDASTFHCRVDRVGP